jgi:ABC-type branched-subunit amino acid transport system substrate-binding protein
MRMIRSHVRSQRSIRTKGIGRLVLSASMVLGVATTISMTSASTASASTSASPITIAYITSVTGEGASEDGTSPGAFKARVALQNAEGGVNGHKIIPLVIDDQTSPSAIATAVQEADSKALGIVSQSPLLFLAAKYPQQAGVPVTGSYSDGPEWGEQPYTNMFAADVGSLNPKYPVTTLAGSLLKKFGATTLGTYGYSISPSSSRAAIQTADSFKHAGGKIGVLDTTVPFGGVDFTAEALSAKQNHVDAISPEMDNNSNFALATALKQAGVKLKASLFATGYQPDVIHSASWSALQGDEFYSLFRPWALPNAATKQMQAAMEKYDGYSKSQFPSFSEYEAWLGADLMIKGLQLAGPNPTRAGVIKALRGVTSYNANGLLPQSWNYSTDFGKDDAKSCTWIMKAEANGFVPVSSQPFCGTDIPGTSTASAS